MNEETELLELNNEDIKEYIELLGKVTRSFMQGKKTMKEGELRKLLKEFGNHFIHTNGRLDTCIESFIKQKQNSFTIKADKDSTVVSDSFEENKILTEISDEFRQVAHNYKDGKIDYRIIWRWFQNLSNSYEIYNKKTDNTKADKDSSGVSEAKKVLFKTEDGKDIYEGDEYYEIDRDFGLSTITGKAWYSPSRGNKYFSTKEVAKNYVRDNKPCLSLNEIERIMSMNIVKGCTHKNERHIHGTATINSLKQVIQQKLNQNL